MVALVVHAVVVVSLVIAYSVLVATGNDGAPLLGVLAGYIGGAGVDRGLAGRAGATP